MTHNHIAAFCLCLFSFLLPLIACYQRWETRQKNRGVNVFTISCILQLESQRIGQLCTVASLAQTPFTLLAIVSLLLNRR